MKKILLLAILTTTLVGCGTKDLEEKPADIQTPTVEQGTIINKCI